MLITLTVTSGPLNGRTFTFEGHDVFLVGRSPNAHARFPEDDPFFSRVHFLIEVNPPRCRLTDMGSRNGTFVNGKKVEVVDLDDNDEIRAGHTRITVRVEHPTTLAPRFGDNVGETHADINLPMTWEPEQTKIPVPQPAAPKPERTITPMVMANGAAAPIVPGYRFIRELGRGNMGIVYLAKREKDGLDVAVKTIDPAQASNPTVTAQFLSEAKTLGQFNHPNIVKFYETGEAGGLLYFVMEHVSGTDVAKVLQERPRVELRTAIRLAIQVLDALAHAHARGLVHRDIKPANILLAELPDGKRQVKLADFGLARVYRASQISGLTHMGDLGGTPAYMPPEQITNYREVMPPADQYSTAAMLYHMLTGNWVFDLPPMPGGLLTILNKEPIPICDRRPDLPAELGAVIHRALAKKAPDRYPDVMAFRQALVPFGR
ncbi:MAG: protein kinase [Planctomycetes bacterium]|nr:protein kinase [Planctomycetota bacterium]